MPEDIWITIENFKTLQMGLSNQKQLISSGLWRILVKFAESIKEANERLKFYCIYENTIDKVATDAERELKRKHPVQYAENDLDYNSMFDE